MKELGHRIQYWKWAHRAAAFLFLVLLFLGAQDWFPWFKGSTTASTILNLIPLADPLAALETTLASGNIEFTILLGALILAGVCLLLGPVFCGWVCPLGFLLDLNHGIRMRFQRILNRFNIRWPAMGIPRQLRYAALGFVLCFSLAAGLPAFQTVSPINLISWILVFSAKPVLDSDPGFLDQGVFVIRSMIDAGGILLVFLVVILAVEYLAPRAWCRSACPLGALYSLLGRFAPLRIRVKEKKPGSEHCSRCTIYCPMGIQVSEEYTKPGKRSVDHPDCTRCGECIETCSRRILRLGFFVLLLVGGGMAGRAEAQAFLDSTGASGVSKLVQAHYDAHPRWWLSGLHLVDLDCDGDLDLFLSSHGGAPALAALNDGKGNFMAAPGTYPSSEILLAYDIDEDGKIDLSMRYQDGGAEWWCNESRPGSLSFRTTGVRRGTNTARRQAIIDIDRDGKADWLRGLGGGICLDLGDGRGEFAEKSRFLATGDDRRSEVLCLPVDIDGDGDLDLLSEWGHYKTPGGNSRIFKNDGKMYFTETSAQAGIPSTGFSIKGAGDVDQDGDPDLICLEGLKRLEIYLNDGSGRFKKKDGAIEDGGKGISAASWGMAVTTDFDNDGVADILVNGKHFLKILRGVGQGKFVYKNADWAIADCSASSIDDGLCFGDIDGDGDLDIIGYKTISGQRRFSIYRNELPRRNWIRIRPVGLPGNRGAAGAKIRIYEPGGSRLLWQEQVVLYNSQAAQSYYGQAQTERHFGLGDRDVVDVCVQFHPSGKSIWRRGVPANSVLAIKE